MEENQANIETSDNQQNSLSYNYKKINYRITENQKYDPWSENANFTENSASLSLWKDSLETKTNIPEEYISDLKKSVDYKDLKSNDKVLELQMVGSDSFAYNISFNKRIAFYLRNH